MTLLVRESLVAALAVLLEVAEDREGGAVIIPTTPRRSRSTHPLD
jgi:hypothetical protein